MSAWPIVALSEICRPKQWPTLSMAEMKSDGFPVYGANGPIGFTDTFTHEEATILVGCRGSCGSVHITVPRSYANGNAMALDDLDKSRVEIRFLAHYLRNRGFRDVTTGTSQPQIIGQNISRVSIPLPPLPEQRRIAAILDKADALRSKRRAALAQLDTLTQSIFLEMFGDPATNPKGWPVRTFDETMRDETSRTEKLQRSDYLPEGRYPVVDQGQSVIAGYCDDDRYLCPSELPVVVFGDHTRAVKLVRHRFVVGADGAKVLAPEPGVDAVYLSYLMRELPIPDLGYSRHMREVKRLAFPTPPSARQQEFAQRVASIEMHCKAHDRSRLALDSLFAALQHRAFRGEL